MGKKKQEIKEYSNPLSLPNVVKAYKELPPEESIVILEQVCAIYDAHSNRHVLSNAVSAPLGIYAMRDEIKAKLEG